MRVLFVYSKAGVGGVETWINSMAEALTAVGHVCAGFFFRAGPLSEAKHPWLPAQVGTLADLTRLATRERFDVVCGAAADYDAGFRFAHQAAPESLLVAVDHGTGTPGWRSTTCDCLTCVSHWLEDCQAAQSDLPVSAILNGIDTSRFCPGEPSEPPREPIVAWVGRSSDLEHKCIDRFALLAPLLAAEGYRVHVIDPEGPGHVPEPARSMLLDAAEWWGGVTYGQMPETYRRIAASGGMVVSTSHSEGLALALLEAQACGCPVAGPRARGVAEAIAEEQGGVLYPEGAPPAQVVAQLMAALSDREALAERGRRLAAHAAEAFSLDRMAAEHLAFWQAGPQSPVRALPRPLDWSILAPLVDFRRYVRNRWSAGHAMWHAALELAATGDFRLARLAATEAWREAPTQFLRPARMVSLLRLRLSRLGGHL